MPSISSSISSSLSSHFDQRERFESWIETNAPTNEWVAKIKDMYEASEFKLDFARAVFGQVGIDFEKLNSDENRKILLDHVIKVSESDVEPWSTTKLPIELMCKIFSYLNEDYNDLARCAQVNKEWRDIIYYDQKKLAYNNSFSNEEWKRCFGDQVLAGEEEQNDFASLPNNIGSILRSPCRAFPGKRVFETHVLFRMNKTVGLTLEGEKKLLTLKTFGELARKYFPDTTNNTGYRYIWGNILDRHGDTPIERSCWVLMTKELLEGSRGKNFVTQQAMVASLASDALGNPLYAVPKTLEATLGILTEYFRTTILGTPEAPEGTPGTRLLNNDGILRSYTRCKEQTLSNVGNAWRNLVGGFALGGVFVDYYYGHDNGRLGVVGSRKF